MARKSNKTTHVLNLIAGSGAEEEKYDNIKTKQEDTAETKKSVPHADSIKGNSPVVKVLTNDYDPLSDVIKDALETEETYINSKTKVSVSYETQSEKGINSAPAIDNTAAAELATKEISSSPVDNEISTQKKITLEQKLEASKSLRFHDRKDINSMLDLDFKYINVYEKIIQDKVLDYMRKFDMCMCDRCIVDTFALTLTNLPTKIVVTDRDSVFPMVSFYETKNTAIISTELIKACMLVKEKPHHE